MTIEHWLKEAIDKLDSSSLPTAKLDAEVLLSDILSRDRTWIHAHSEASLQRSDLRKLDEQVKRRMEHEPLAYIRGKQEFYGRDFIVSPDTLTPRPETETMVELALEVIKSQKSNVESLQIMDVGTGSGCIIITTALELAQISNIKYQISYLGLDISEPALKIAKLNAKKLDTKVDLKKYDLLSETLDLSQSAGGSTLNLILANLPYVPNGYEINLAASHEPEFAIYGGEDGLDYYRRLFSQLSKKLNNCVVITESLPLQHSELAKIAERNGFKLINTQDLIQVFTKN